MNNHDNESLEITLPAEFAEWRTVDVEDVQTIQPGTKCKAFVVMGKNYLPVPVSIQVDNVTMQRGKPVLTLSDPYAGKIRSAGQISASQVFKYQAMGVPCSYAIIVKRTERPVLRLIGEGEVVLTEGTQGATEGE